MLDRKLVLLGFLPLWTVACAQGAPDQEGSDTTTTASLAYSGWTSCELDKVIALLNDSATTATTLTAAGVHSRAASNLMAARDGALPGTEDDVLFKTLAEVDAVSYVGDAALEQLRAAVTGTCTAPTPDPTTDPTTEPAAPSPACLEAQTLLFLNDPGITAPALIAAGVHSQASNKLVARRFGANGVEGGGDDHLFTSLTDVDATPYVGDAAMAQLQSAIEHLCTVSEPAAPQKGIEVIFSPQDYAKSHLARVAELIDGAQESIDIAMYSYKDAAIASALERAVARGVSIRMIFDGALADYASPSGTPSAAIENLGIDVRYINKIMHHKFALIDGPRLDVDEAPGATLITGSGNWSNSAATRYDENTLFIHGDVRLTLLYQQEFNTLWQNSRDLVWNPAFTSPLTSTPVTSEMIPADATVDAAFTSANFRAYVSSTYGATFALVTGRNTAADRIVALIQSAQTSIHIASGHLRSRPIAEALKAKADSMPGLDIKIILDGQEYVSYWAQAEQEKEQQKCLEAAGTSVSKIQKCYDVDYKYGNDMHLHGGIALRYKFYAYRWDYAYAKQLHHKYTIVDGRWLATGSFNYSDNAEHNTMENVVVLDGAAYPELVASYEANFASLWTKGEAEGLYPALMDKVTNGTGSFGIVFEGMALDTDQIYELKKAIKAACPDVETAPYRDEPATHQICFR